MRYDLFNFFHQHLQQTTLPGRSSQLKMAPRPLNPKDAMRKMDAPPEADASSVLLLIFPDEGDRFKLIITLRSHSINHGGQLSLPGGRAEDGETPTETALREASEEIDIHPKDVSVAGQLSKLYVAHSNNYVTPVVGFLNGPPKVTINPDEVKEAFSVELDSLLDKENLVIENWDLGGKAMYKVPYWNVHRVPLWGATAMILSEFLELYRTYKNRESNNTSQKDGDL